MEGSGRAGNGSVCVLAFQLKECVFCVNRRIHQCSGIIILQIIPEADWFNEIAHQPVFSEQIHQSRPVLVFFAEIHAKGMGLLVLNLFLLRQHDIKLLRGQFLAKLKHLLFSAGLTDQKILTDCSTGRDGEGHLNQPATVVSETARVIGIPTPKKLGGAHGEVAASESVAIAGAAIKAVKRNEEPFKAVGRDEGVPIGHKHTAHFRNHFAKVRFGNRVELRIRSGQVKPGIGE